MKNAPSIQFYPKDYLADANVRMLSYAQRGIYMDLLCFCWERDGLPSNLELIRKMLGLSARESRSLLPEVMSLFVKTELGYHHERLLKQQELYAERRDKARESASKRWHNSSNANACETHMPTHCEDNAIIGEEEEEEVEEEKQLDKSVPVKREKKPDAWQDRVQTAWDAIWPTLRKKTKPDFTRKSFFELQRRNDRVRLAFFRLAIAQFNQEMDERIAENGDNKTVTRLSAWLNDHEWEDDRYQHLHAEAEILVAEAIARENGELPLVQAHG